MKHNHLTSMHCLLLLRNIQINLNILHLSESYMLEKVKQAHDYDEMMSWLYL